MKKFLLTGILLILVFLFSFSSVFAIENTDMKNTGNAMGNVVEGAKNVVENTASGIGSTVKDGMNSVRDFADNKTMEGQMKDEKTDNNYTATRTATEDTSTFAGMTATGWTWFVFGILGVLLIGLVWYYAKQNTTETTGEKKE